MSLFKTLLCPMLDRRHRSDARPVRLFTRSNGSVNEFVVFPDASIG
jgi:hypothetical protein